MCDVTLPMCISYRSNTNKLIVIFFQTQSERRNATPKNFDSIMLMLIVNNNKIRRLIFSLGLNSYLAVKYINRYLMRNKKIAG